jgi:hypothetical protein
MESTFWISTVQYKITVPPWTLGSQPVAVSPAPRADGAPLPTFVCTPPATLAAPKTISVEATQIQYSQTVLLNFRGLSWPHVSVATLIQDDAILIPATHAAWK